MNSIYVPHNSSKNLTNVLNQLSTNNAVKSVLFLMADEDKYENNIIEPLLHSFKKPIIGGVFPELIYNGKREKKGVLLISLSFKLTTQLFNLSDSQEDYLEQLEKVQNESTATSSSLIVFTDALSDRKDNFIEALFNFFGINSTYIGGGTGSLKFNHFKSIISNKGIFENAAVIGWAPRKIALGVAHGWHAISTPLKVTKSSVNKIIEINWKPAFQVYKNIVEKHSGLKFTDSNFFEIAKSYPLGISKLDSENVVRDPFKVTDNTIHLIDNINEGEYIEILHGNMESLLNGAKNAKEKAFLKVEKQTNSNFIFCIDCISRALYMQEDFSKELEIVSENVNTSGVLSIGEIANSEESFLEIYNKTIVFSLW